MCNQEVWRKVIVPGYNIEYYEVSNLGRVRSLPRTCKVQNIRRRDNVCRDEFWFRKGKILSNLKYRRKKLQL